MSSRVLDDLIHALLSIRPIQCNSPTGRSHHRPSNCAYHNNYILTCIIFHVNVQTNSRYFLAAITSFCISAISQLANCTQAVPYALSIEANKIKHKSILLFTGSIQRDVDTSIIHTLPSHALGWSVNTWSPVTHLLPSDRGALHRGEGDTMSRDSAWMSALKLGCKSNSVAPL